jgi:hypothetical protein
MTWESDHKWWLLVVVVMGALAIIRWVARAIVVSPFGIRHPKLSNVLSAAFGTRPQRGAPS